MRLHLCFSCGNHQLVAADKGLGNLGEQIGEGQARRI